MNAFLVDLDNKPGEFARISEAIAKKGINITTISGTTCGSIGRVALATDNDGATRSALAEANCTYSESEVTEATLRNQPGALAAVARRLADAGVNIEAIMPTGMKGNDVTVAFVTDNPTTARGLLQEASTAR
jgi:hypothetical protein